MLKFGRRCRNQLSRFSTDAELKKESAQLVNMDRVLPASISRYVPSDTSSFLVEEHRLTEAEKITQQVSSVTPWLLFGVFAASPFFVMKYHLDRLSTSSDPSLTKSTTESHKPTRYAFKRVKYEDMPEIIERRTPTLVGIVSNNYHSVVVSKMFEEIDSIFEQHGININVILLDATTADGKFQSTYKPSLAPYCQLITPTATLDRSVVEYEGTWTIDSIMQFVLPGKKDDMHDEIVTRSEKMAQWHDELFRNRFVMS